jgi:hypothetical protein
VLVESADSRSQFPEFADTLLLPSRFRSSDVFVGTLEFEFYLQFGLEITICIFKLCFGSGYLAKNCGQPLWPDERKPNITMNRVSVPNP